MLRRYISDRIRLPRGCWLKRALQKPIEIVPPVGWVVRVAVDIPVMRDFLVRQIHMCLTADSKERVLGAAGKVDVGLAFAGDIRVRDELYAI
jgi:hypothetical protein